MNKRTVFIFLVWFITTGFASAQITPGTTILGNNLRFGRLGGIGSDSSGSMVITEHDGSRFTKFSTSLVPIFSVRQSPVGSYDLQNPVNPFVRTNGQLLIPDIGSDKVLLFDSLGQYVTSIEGTPTKGLADPSQVTEDAAGAIYVADTNNHRIIKFNPDRTLAWEIGTYGTAQGQFRFPSGIAITSSNQLVVSDQQNNRLQVFSVDGTFIRDIDTSASGLGVLKPSSITSVGDGRIWVVSNGTGKVFKIDLAGQILVTIDYSSVSPGKPNPVSVVVAGSRVLVADGEACQIYRFSLDGTYQDKVLSGLDDTSRLNLPHNTIIHNNQYFVADSGSHRIAIHDIDGKFLRSFGSFGDTTGLLQHPSSVAANSDGLLAIADTGNHRIQVMQQDGTTVRTIPGTGANFTLSYPTQAVWGDNGSLWIVDQNNSCIRLVDATGNLVRTIGGRGASNGKFDSPFALAVAPNGDVIVSDTYNHRLQRFASDGTFISSVGSLGSGPGQFVEPKGIIVFNQGLYAVADSGNHRIQIFRLDGTFVATYGNFGDKNGEFISPEHLSVFGTNQIIVTDSSTHKVTTFVSGIDLTPPKSTIVVDPNVGANWSNRSVQVFISATDLESGVKEVHYSINGGIEQVVSGSSAMFTLTETGSYDLVYWAVDNENKVENPNYYTVKIDKIAPVTTLSQSAGLITLSATDAHSGVAKIKYQINGGAVADYSAPFADTVHKVTYWAEDVAGNIESAKTDIINAGVQSITVSQNRIPGGIGVVGTVTLDKAAGVGGTVINLASSLPGVALVDATVTVPEGATSATFDIDANPVAVDTSVSITASIYETSQSALVTVQAPTPSSVIWSVSPVTGGTSTVGTVSISGPAPTGGTTVSLASSSLSAIVGSSVTIPAGAMTATFTVSTNAVSNDTSAVISATVYGAKLKSTLSILGPKVTSVTLAASSVVSLGTTTGTVTLSTNAPVGGKVVSLSSSNAAVASVPVSVTVAAGTKTATFTVTAGSVNASSTATITAATNGSTGLATLTVTPPPAAISGITTSVAAVTGGLAVTGTVTLTSPAPTGGAVIALASTPTTAGTVPASVTVAAGATTATFTITTKTVTAATTLTVTGTYLGVAKAASITVNPARVVSTLTLNPTTVKGGTNSTGTITLTGIATENVVVSLTSGTTTVATVPTSVTVPAGSTTATFTITTLAQTATKTSILTAKTGTTSKTATLSVTK